MLEKYWHYNGEYVLTPSTFSLTERVGGLREGEGGGFPSSLRIGGLEDWRAGVGSCSVNVSTRLEAQGLAGFKQKINTEFYNYKIHVILIYDQKFVKL